MTKTMVQLAAVALAADNLRTDEEDSHAHGVPAEVDANNTGDMRMEVEEDKEIDRDLRKGTDNREVVGDSPKEGNDVDAADIRVDIHVGMVHLAVVVAGRHHTEHVLAVAVEVAVAMLGDSVEAVAMVAAVADELFDCCSHSHPHLHLRHPRRLIGHSRLYSDYLSSSPSFQRPRVAAV